MSNTVYEQENVITESFCYSNGKLKLDRLLSLVQESSLGGSAFLGAGVEDIKKNHIFWVVMSYRFEIARWPSAGEKVTISTYPGETKAFVYPRHYVMKDAKGEVIVRGIGLWALLDTTSHRPTLPPANGVSLKAEKSEGELPWPPSLKPNDLVSVEKRPVRLSDLDFNGHMNNVRYLDFALDAETKDFLLSKEAASLQINFQSETMLGKEMEILISKGENPRLYEGRVDGKPVFAAKIEFKN